MKISKWTFALILLFGMVIASQAQAAPVLFMEPYGQQGPISVGDTLAIDVFLHADTTDLMNLWTLDLGYDQTELTFMGITHNPTTVLIPQFFGQPVVQASTKYSDKMELHDVSAARLPTGDAESLVAGQDFLLFTASFTFNGGLWDGEDVWIESEMGQAFGFANAGTILTADLEIYTDSSKMSLLGNNGADYAVPIPGAVWLLGSGLIGLVGIRRKFQK